MAEQSTHRNETIADPKVSAVDMDAHSPIEPIRRNNPRMLGGSMVDVPYTLWLATVATALMSVICLGLNLGGYLLDAVFSFQGAAPLMTHDTHIKMFELTAIFAVIAIVAHLLRLRLEAMRTAAILVPLPFRTIALPPASDLKSRFECSCRITLALDNEQPLVALQSRRETLKLALNNAFVVAITDPDIRFSRAKMEQTLKVAVHHVLGDGVAGVQIAEIRQRRLPATPIPPVGPAEASPANDGMALESAAARA